MPSKIGWVSFLAATSASGKRGAWREGPPDGGARSFDDRGGLDARLEGGEDERPHGVVDGGVVDRWNPTTSDDPMGTKERS